MIISAETKFEKLLSIILTSDGQGAKIKEIALCEILSRFLNDNLKNQNNGSHTTIQDI